MANRATKPTDKASEVSPEMQRLQSIVGDIPTEANQETAFEEADKPEQPLPELPYDQVPYLNNDITFKDREAELALLIQLLDFRKKKAVEELYYVQNCRDHKYYPDIVHQGPNVGN
jgi:hypothetical protein